MEELSIEEKAKAYDEAIERAKSKIKNDKDHVLYEDDIIDIFPALKESKDERIRKWLINYFREVCDNVAEKEKNAVLAWLEKQGEQKPTIEMKTVEESLGIDSDTYIKIVDECIYGEQKPTDKVEPKFHEGEWITNGDYTWKIVEIKPLNYILQSQYGSIVDDTISHVDEQFHSFTIEDAKDGDVLAYNDSKNNVWVCIFKEYANERVYDYCTLDKESFWEHGNWNYLASFSYTPATKEQRDLLFQKMKEAGYEWDTEQKELKKEKVDNLHNYLYGEQKPAEWSSEQSKTLQTDDVPKESSTAASFRTGAIGFDGEPMESKPCKQNPTWSKEDDYVIERLFCLLHNEQDKYPQQSSESKELEEIENKLNSFKDRMQPQSKWSEEDEKEMGRVIYMMEQLDLTESWSDCYTFLNSLKNRMQPKQEWKQENTGDLTNFENAMMHIGNSFFGDNAGLDPNNTNAIKEQANLLLELVPKQKWNEEDEKIYKSIIYSFAHNYPLTVQQQGFVKSLRPQNTWKPSDEQMKALKEALSLAKNCGEEWAFDLRTLYEQLNKLREE